MALVIGCTSQSTIENNSLNTSAENSKDIFISLNEFESHNTKEDCFVVFRSEIYDVTNFISKHSGGEEAISRFCGIKSVAFEEAFIGKHEEGKVETLKREGTLIGKIQ